LENQASLLKHQQQEMLRLQEIKIEEEKEA
jgi:hypothetical protein